MTDNVTPLFAVNTLAKDSAGVAANLRHLADEIEAGQCGVVRNVIVVMSNGAVTRVTIGNPINRAEMIGLLSVALHKASCDACEDGA